MKLVDPFRYITGMDGGCEEPPTQTGVTTNWCDHRHDCNDCIMGSSNIKSNDYVLLRRVLKVDICH